MSEWWRRTCKVEKRFTFYLLLEAFNGGIDGSSREREREEHANIKPNNYLTFI